MNPIEKICADLNNYIQEFKDAFGKEPGVIYVSPIRLKRGGILESITEYYQWDSRIYYPHIEHEGILIKEGAVMTQYADFQFVENLHFLNPFYKIPTKEYFQSNKEDYSPTNFRKALCANSIEDLAILSLDENRIIRAIAVAELKVRERMEDHHLHSSSEDIVS